MKYEKGSFITVPTSSIVGIGVGPQALYMWLCKYANQDGECFPSRTTLANNMGCSDRSIDSYLQTLVDIGLVKKEHQFNKEGEYTSNKYYLPMGGGEKSSLPSENSSGGVAKNLRTELNPLRTQSNELIYVQDENSKKPKTNLRGFEEFWSLYPKKVDKASASAAWRKLSEEDRFAVLDDVPKRIKSPSWREENGKYIPLAKNYLSNRRWEDELPKAPKIMSFGKEK